MLLDFCLLSPALASLASMYTNAISSSNAACMEDVVTNISMAENTAAVKEATQHYENKMKEKVKIPTETFDQIIELSEECEKEALEIFMKRSFKDNDRQFHKQFWVSRHYKCRHTNIILGKTTVRHL